MLFFHFPVQVYPAALGIDELVSSAPGTGVRVRSLSAVKHNSFSFVSWMTSKF